MTSPAKCKPKRWISKLPNKRIHLYICSSDHDMQTCSCVQSRLTLSVVFKKETIKNIGSCCYTPSEKWLRPSFPSLQSWYFLSGSICKQGPWLEMEMEEEEQEATGSYGRGPRRGKKQFLKSGRQEFLQSKPGWLWRGWGGVDLPAKHSAFPAGWMPFEIQLQAGWVAD